MFNGDQYNDLFLLFYCVFFFNLCMNFFQTFFLEVGLLQENKIRCLG